MASKGEKIKYLDVLIMYQHLENSFSHLQGPVEK